ncbi:MAG: hypothetical protein WC917_00705 [Bacilli bacterium]|jgi:hypothetical protein
MANLQENTQYGTNGTQPSIANLSNIMKGLQTKTQTTSSDTVKSALTSHFNPNVAASIFSPGKPSATSSQPSGVFPVNEPIGQQVEGARTEAIPGYEQFKTTDPAGKWVAPSASATLRNWPTSLGGGQYVTDPTQPGKMIKSDRVLWDENMNPGGKKAALGQLSSKLYQVDHIVPLWIGGADTAANSEILDIPTHERKTAVQSVPLTLLANGKIDLNQAKLMALTWKSKDSSGLPSPDDKGYVPLDVAEKMAKKWEDDVSHPSMWKYFGSSFKENMSNFGEGWLPDPIREFAKGLVGGGTAGIVPGTGVSEDSGTLGTIGNVAGNIVGTITGLGLLTKGVVKVLGGAKAVLGIKNAVAIADEAVQSAGLVSDIGNVASTVSKARVQTLSKMAKSAGLLSLWGQIGLTGREVTGQDNADFKNHVGQFMTDVAFGGLLGSAGQSLKGYATVGLGATSLSLMEGEEIVPALQNGALMTALHGMGYKKGIKDPKTTIGNEEAYKMASTTFNQYVGEQFPTIKKGQPVPTILTFETPKIEQLKAEYKAKYPNDTRFDNVTDSGGAVQILGRNAKRSFLDVVKRGDGTISQDQIAKEMTRITTAENQLYNQTLEPSARLNKEWQDLLSMGEKLRPQTKSDQFKQAKNKNEILNKIPEVTTEIIPKTDKTVYPTGKSGITGYGGNLDAEAKFTVDDFAKNPSNYDGKIYIPKTDAETASIMRLLEQEQISHGSSIGNPNQTLRAFVRTTEGEFKAIGYVPQEKSFDLKKDNLNKTYQFITNRLQEIRKSAKTPEAMMDYYNADKAGIKIDLKTAQELFARRAENIPDEELYSILKPINAYTKLDSSLNNANLSNTMDKLGLNYLVVDPFKAWEIDGNRPRWNPENPYASIEITDQSWLQSIKMNKTSKLTPVEDAIKKVTEQLKATELAKTMKSIQKPPQATLPLKEAAKKVAEIAPKMAAEAPIAPVATSLPAEAVITPKTPEVAKTRVPSEQYRTIQSVVSKDPTYTATTEFFNDMVARIDDVKLKAYVSPEDFKKNMMNIIGSFKRKNPGLSEKDFKNAMSDAKGRAEAYVQDEIDRTFHGTKYFGTQDSYTKKMAGPEKNVLERRLDELNRVEKGRGTEDDPGLILRPSEKVEVADLKTKIKQYADLEKQSAEIEKKANSEGRSLTEEEKKILRGLEQKRFTVSEKYQRDPNLVMANKYGLKLTDPNEAGLQYLVADKQGNPVFSDEYLKLHDVKGQTPLQHWGSFLKGDWEVSRSMLTKNVQDWGKSIESMKGSKKPYAKAWAETLDAIFTEKFGPKWKTSWKLNSALKDMKEMFAQKNPEGHGISETNRGIAARTLGNNPIEIKKRVAKANAVTKAISEEAQSARIRDFGVNEEKSVLYQGDSQVYDRVKDANQIKNVIEDLTPFEIMMNGLITNPEARTKLITDYNALRREMGSGLTKPTITDAQGKTTLGTADEMKLVFNQIKALSVNLPQEVKKWKLGQKIEIKNNEPTTEQAIKDAYNVAMSIIKKKKTPGYVKFENIKETVLNKLNGTKKPDGEGGPYDGQGGFWGKVGDAITSPFSSTITYNREDYLREQANKTANTVTEPPTKRWGLFGSKPKTVAPTSYDVRGIKVNDSDITEGAHILYGEISNRDPERQKFEVRNAVNTAINRANENPARYGGSLTKVLQEPAQYQSYAPEGIKKDGKVVESQYQKLKRGAVNETDKQKLQVIMDTLNEMKSGSFADTTGGKTFYVHANDGTMWLGKTQKEAKDAANKHEKSMKTKPTNWGTVAGFPHGAERGF